MDGTFLGGDDEQRSRLYSWIAQRRAAAAARTEPGIGLVFVTGRDMAFIESLCAAGFVPWPDFVIGDVGTTIAAVTNGSVVPIPDLEQRIRTAWADRGDRVRDVLKNHPGLSIQDARFRYRVSYDWDPTVCDPSEVAALLDSDLDVLSSDGRFLDVLPGGISKGPSLLHMLERLGIADDRVLVAGDTLNDLSMFHTGLAGAVVGGAEPALLDATAGLANVHHCALPGAAGIGEAVHTFNLHPAATESVIL